MTILWRDRPHSKDAVCATLMLRSNRLQLVAAAGQVGLYGLRFANSSISRFAQGDAATTLAGSINDKSLKE